MKRITVILILGALLALGLTLGDASWLGPGLGQADEEQPPDLMAYWKFDEGGGEGITDETANHNDGTIYGPKWVEGKSGYALQFDGVDDYTEVPDSDSLDLAEGFTIAAWINLAEVGKGRQALLQKKVPGESDVFTDYTFYVQWTADLLALVIGDGERRVGALSDRGLGAAGGWHHVAVTFSKEEGEVRFYIDGEFAGATDITLSPHTNNGPLLIGRYTSGMTPKFHLKGTIDELRIYSRALTDKEIKELLQ